MKRPVLPAMVSTGVSVVLTMAISAPMTAKTIAPQTHATVVIHRPKWRKSGSPFKCSVTVGTQWEQHSGPICRQSPIIKIDNGGWIDAVRWGWTYTIQQYVRGTTTYNFTDYPLSLIYIVPSTYSTSVRPLYDEREIDINWIVIRIHRKSQHFPRKNDEMKLLTAVTASKQQELKLVLS